MFKFIKKRNHFSKEVLKCVQQGNDFSKDVLTFVKITNQSVGFITIRQTTIQKVLFFLQCRLSTSVFCKGHFLKCSTALLSSLVLEACRLEPGRKGGRNKGL